jgi:hypothetical protein
MKKIIINTILPLYVATVFATNAYSAEIVAPEKYSRQVGVTLDKNYSPYVGSSIAMSALELYDMLESNIYDKDNPNMLANSARFISSLFFNSALFVANHEIYGHGYRLREANIDALYKVSIASGATYFSAYQYDNAHAHKRTMINLGGMEASTVLSKEIRQKWLREDSISSNYAMLYFLSAQDQTSYIRRAKTSEGNDVEAYVRELNKTYGKGYMSKNKLKNYALLDYLDPFLYYSIYSAVINDKDFSYHMFSIGGYKYLPSARVLLTPYGPEAQILNFIKYDQTVTQVNLSYGKNKIGKTYSLEVDMDNLYYEDKLSLGFNSAIWKQPELLTSNPAQASMKFGGQLAVKSTYNMTDTIRLEGLLGYKTKGYKLGEALSKGVFIRLGFKVNI